MSEKIREQYEAFARWCCDNPQRSLDPRLHQHAGPIERGGYIADPKTASAFAAWRAALAQQPAPAAPVVREPVAFVSQETFSSDGTSDILTRNLPIGTALYAVPPAAEQAPRELFTCIGKGGRYELLGESSGAGGCRREGRVIYRCLDTGQLYHRTDDDFAARMAPLTEDGEA